MRKSDFSDSLDKTLTLKQVHFFCGPNSVEHQRQEEADDNERQKAT